MSENAQNSGATIINIISNIDLYIGASQKKMTLARSPW